MLEAEGGGVLGRRLAAMAGAASSKPAITPPTARRAIARQKSIAHQAAIIGRFSIGNVDASRQAEARFRQDY